MPIVLAASVEHASVFLSLFIILAAAKVMAEIFERLRQPAVVGEILAGVVIGPSLLGWVHPSDFISILAEVGVILPFIAGYLIAICWDGSFVEAMLIGAALVATSV